MIAPSPLPTRTFPTAIRYFYVDGIDMTPWANRGDLQNAVDQYSLGQAQTMVVRLEAMSAGYPAAGIAPQPRPVIRQGMVPCVYVERHGTAVSDYTSLFGGLVSRNGISPNSIVGSIVLTVDTPYKLMQHQLRAVRFYPQTTGDDIARIRSLGHKWGNATFDFSLPTNTPSITFEPPRIYYDGAYVVSPDPDTVYTNKTVLEILTDICTDPGNPRDTGYPVGDRQFRILSVFKDDTDPTLGLIFRLQVFVTNPPHYAGDGYDLLDEPDSTLTNGLLYEMDGDIDIDYRPVIRRVTVAGRQYGNDLGQPRADTFLATGDTHSDWIYNFSYGWVRKVGGTDGAWDCSAIGNYDIWQDQDFHFQVLESYLAHDPFQGDDNDALQESSLQTLFDPAFPDGLWNSVYMDTVEANHNVMRRLNKQAVALYTVRTAISLMDAKAATCIVRATISHNVTGAAVLVRASYNAAPAFTLASAIILWNNGGSYELVDWTGGSSTVLATMATAPAENQRIKLNCKYNEIQVFFNDALDANGTVATSAHSHDTQYGVGQFDWGSGLTDRTTFSDFQVSTFWADRAIGVGSERSPQEAGHLEWSWIGYGIVFNVNGTMDLIRGGIIVDSLGVGDYGQPGTVYTFADLDTYQAGHGGALPPDVPYTWSDVLAAHNIVSITGYSYDDVGRFTVVKYHDPVDNLAKWKVQWWYQVGGDGEDVLLREQLALPENTLVAPNQSYPAEPTKWYHQVALKELGATFANVGATDNYSNVFICPASLAPTPLVGDFPATAVVQNDYLNTYDQREKVSRGIFRVWAEPVITMPVRVMAKQDVGFETQPYSWFSPGVWARVRSRIAGWLGTARPLLLVKSVQRVEGGVQGRLPQYRYIMSSSPANITDPARTHLLKPDTRTYLPRNLEVPELSGVAYYFSDPPSPDMYYGEHMEVQVNEVGHPPLPSFTLPAGVFSFELPKGTFAPGTLFESRHRTWLAGIPSEWSAKYPGTVPPEDPYSRPYVVNFPLGDGINPLSVPPDTTFVQEIQINEAAVITSWAIALNLAGAVTYDVQWCSAEARNTTGATAYASLCGTGQQPYTVMADPGFARRGVDFRNWAAKRTTLSASDWLRVVCVLADGGTLATLGTLSLTLTRGVK